MEYYNERLTPEQIDEMTYFFVGNEDYSGYYENMSDEIVSLKDKSIYRVGSPTTTYNALAFAFYMYWQNTAYSGSACWMMDASEYINDKSYIPVNDPQVNDIVCYYSNSGIVNAGVVEYVFENEASDPTDSRAFVKKLSKINVKSVWENYGLYQHRGDQCPFVGKYTKKSPDDKETTSVKFFRRHETHTYTHKYTMKDEKYHYEYCVCGERITGEHRRWERLANRRKRCTYCNYITEPFLLGSSLLTAMNFDFTDIYDVIDFEE